MGDTRALSLGEKRVRVVFNPSANSDVDRIKQETAHLIDFCEAGKNQRRDADDSKSAGERARLWALAQTAYEEAAMWAVKAATA